MMTYCVGILLDEGLVFASDSRTNAGVDRVATYPKMKVFAREGDRVLVLLTAGNLAVTQSVASLLEEWTEKSDRKRNLFAVDSLFDAARIVGAAVREIDRLDGAALRHHNLKFNVEMILGGQIADEEPRLFNIYAAGNFIEAGSSMPYFQIGEVKYGKPIIDRVVGPGTDLLRAAKCALISFDSTMRSNVSVGPPIDLLCYRRDSLRVSLRRQFDENDAYFHRLREAWAEGIHRVFDGLPDLGPDLGDGP